MLSANGDDVVVAWFNAKDNEGHAFAAFSSDAGRTFGSPIQLDERTSLGRVDIEILPDGSAIASWIEYANNRAEFFVRHIDRTGKRSSPVLVTPLMTTVGHVILFLLTIVFKIVLEFGVEQVL